MKLTMPRKTAIKLMNIGLLVAGQAGAEAFATEVYHWKDANGETHFSDQRGAAAGAHTMTVDTPERRPNPELDQYRQAVKVNLAALDAERRHEAEQEASRKIVAASVKQNCKELRNAILAEENASVLYTFDDSGERLHLDDQQRDSYKSSLKQQWQNYCD